jgi:hypothetical protein
MKLVDLSACKTHTEALKILGADFEAEKVDLFSKDANGNDIINPTHCRIQRKDNGEYLWTHGKDYGLEQYTEEFSRLESIMDNGLLTFNNGYMLGVGEKVLINLTDANEITLWDKLRIVCNYTVRSSKDGSWRWSISCTPQAPGINTYLSLNPKDLGGSSVRRKHSKYFTRNMNVDKKDLVSAKIVWKEFENELVTKGLQHVKFSNDITLDDYLEAIVPGTSEQAQNTRDLISALAVSTLIKMYPAAQNTVCGAYIAATIYFDRLNAKKRKRLDSESADIEMKMTGSAAKQKALSFNKMIWFASRILGVR